MKRLTTILLLVLAAVPVLAQDVSRQKERKKQIEQEIALIDKQLDANTSKRKESLNTLILTRQKLNARKKLIAQLDSDIAGYNKDIAGTNAQIDRLNARLDTLRKYHADLVLGAYKTRDNKIWFMYLLSSKDINQGLRRWSYLKNISSSIRRQATQIKDTEYELRMETARLEGLKAESVAARTERERERACRCKKQEEFNEKNNGKKIVLTEPNESQVYDRRCFRKKKEPTATTPEQVDVIRTLLKSAGVEYSSDVDLAKFISWLCGGTEFSIRNNGLVPNIGYGNEEVLKEKFALIGIKYEKGKIK